MTMAEDFNGCPFSNVVALNDTLTILSGKWKLNIIRVLFFSNYRFNELQKKIPHITPRMLSKELKELELNSVVKRTVHSGTPVTVEYELTPSGRRLKTLVAEMVKWGIAHREYVIDSNFNS